MKISTIEAKYRRSGLHLKDSSLWSSLSKDNGWMEYFSKELTISEKGIFGYFPEEDSAWLITTSRIIIASGNKSESWPTKEFHAVDVPAMLNGDLPKTHIDCITLLGDRRSLSLKIELRSWPIVLSLLQFIITNKEGIEPES